jgi:hypothetical protein
MPQSRRALIVAVSRTQNGAPYNELAGAAKNAGMMVELLSSVIAGDFEIITLSGPAATHDRILEVLSDLARSTKDNDVLVLAVSAHGGMAGPIDDDEDYFDAGDASVVYESEISAILNSVIQRAPGVGIYCLYDCCRAVQPRRKLFQRLWRTLAFKLFSPSSPPESLRRHVFLADDMRGWVDVRGCAPGGECSYWNDDHGVFTRSFVTAITDLQSSRVLPSLDLAMPEVYQRMYVENQGAAQVPQARGPSRLMSVPVFSSPESVTVASEPKLKKTHLN